MLNIIKSEMNDVWLGTQWIYLGFFTFKEYILLNCIIGMNLMHFDMTELENQDFVYWLKKVYIESALSICVLFRVQNIMGWWVNYFFRDIPFLTFIQKTMCFVYQNIWVSSAIDQQNFHIKNCKFWVNRIALKVFL